MEDWVANPYVAESSSSDEEDDEGNVEGEEGGADEKINMNLILTHQTLIWEKHLLRVC